jgi:hypothetical protein
MLGVVITVRHVCDTCERMTQSKYCSDNDKELQETKDILDISIGHTSHLQDLDDVEDKTRNDPFIKRVLAPKTPTQK